MKKSRKVISLLLSVIMIMTSFVVAAPLLVVDADAAISIDGVTQERVVGPDGSYAATYDGYAVNYLNGASEPTDIVIPGLNPEQDYVIQGMTYYPDRDWMLVTAYHNVADGETTQSSKVFALDAATGEFVAMFSFINPDGTVNADHGGGIAVSEHNIYYSCGDKDTKIAYAPLSKLAEAEEGVHTQIQLVDTVDLLEVGSVTYDSKTAYTAYVCYDEGVLWTGNFYDLGAKLLGVTIAAADYNAPANDLYNSMVFGYRLAGNSSEEEWDHFKGKFQNLLHIATASGTSTANGSTFTWNAYENGSEDSIVGNITAPTSAVGEFVGNGFGTCTLTEGVNYTIEFTSTNINTDMYMFSPAGTHTNVKQSTQTTITELEDGRYHYSMNFTAGLKPANADSAWPTTQSTDGSYTGTYTVRFDQDAISAGETREFAITDIKIAQTNTYANGESVNDEGSVGAPSYALGLSNNLKDVQYATVDNGKLYLSRSYGSGAGNSLNFGFGESSWLTVADIDLSVPGTRDITIKTASGNKTIKAHEISKFTDYPMMPMSEGLCVIEDNIFITFEGASNKYLNESSGLTSIGNCEKPVDVIWQVDPYELMEVEVAEPEKSIHYEKVNSLSEIKNGSEYIIVHESELKDPVTQKNYLYALNADGNFKDYKLSKSTSDIVMGYDGMIGHPISHYTIEEEIDITKLYLEEPETDDIEAVRWTISKNADGSYGLKTTETYFANYNYLYFDQDQISMAPGNSGYLSNMKIMESGNGKGGFWLSNADTYFLWCNDGSNADYNRKINSFYINNSGAKAIYAGVSEIPGTFHCDALNLSGQNIIGESVSAEENYKDGVFYIYRRVVDEVASTYESRVYTNMGAELQADGTYTVTLETYAISPNHYQYVGERPTDYIIVADTSSSMDTKDSTGILSYNSDLAVQSLCLEANTSDDNGEGVSGYGFTKPDEQIYYKHTDGKYYKVRLAVNTTELKKIIGIISSMRQLYWAYYIADDGLYYVLQSEGIEGGVAGGVWPGITSTEFYYNVDNGIKYSEYSTKTSNSNRRTQSVFKGPHYRFTTNDPEITRISTLQNAANGLVDAIAAQNADNRIALVQYGSDSNTGFYNTSGTLSKTDYTNAFWSVSNKDTLKAKINAFTTSAQTDNSGIELEYAKNILIQGGGSYKVDGDRNVAVILLSDGMPGADTNDETTTKTAANTVITKAKVLKDNGAFVYTAIVGNASLGEFNKKTYMECVSTKYAEAEGMGDEARGGQSVDGTRYSLNLATCTIDNFLYFGEQTNEQIVNNAAVGLENLDATSYLREKLTEAFLFPDDFNEANDLDVDLVPGVFDMIGRFSFDEDAKVKQVNGATGNVSWTLSTKNRSITLTNYNYGEQYISRYNDGNKLRVTIRNLIANKDAKIQNTSINDTADTGIYKNNTALQNSVEFKELPTEYFNIPEYTYVLDYGLQMYDAEVNGTLCSVSDAPTKQDVDAYLAKAPETQKSANGLVEITDDSLDLIYTSTPDNFADSGYCLIKRDDGTYDWFEIKVVPGSNVLFEENYFEDGKAGSAGWTQDGSPIKTQQAPSSESDIYGHDEAYVTTDHAHSNGSAYKTSVTTTAKRSTTKTIDFVGTGFDLISACGTNTGMMAVSVKDKDGKIIKGFVVDTYYNPAEEIVNVANSNGLVCQTPVISYTAPEHGNYTVETTAVYLSSANALQHKSVTGTKANGKLAATTGVPVSETEAAVMLAEVGLSELAAADLELVWFDDNSVLNGGSGAAGNTSARATRADGSTVTSLDCYIDGFRIYKPLGDDSSEYIDSEKGAVYYNVVKHLQNDGVTSSDIGLSYVEMSQLPEDAETGVAPTLSFATYEQFGPQNEFYLKGNGSGALAFKVALNTPDSRVHLGLRAVQGTATIAVGVDNPDTTDDERFSFTINGATEMYYDITDYVASEGGVATITIQNTDANVVAINNVKVTGDATVVALDEQDLSDAAAIMMEEPVTAEVVNGVVTPVVEDTETDTETDTDNGSGSGSSNLSFFEQIIAKIMEILSSIFKFIPVGEVA